MLYVNANYGAMIRLQKLAGRTWFSTLKYMPQVKLVGKPVVGVNGKWYFVTTFSWDEMDDLPAQKGFCLHKFDPQVATIDRVFSLGIHSGIRSAFNARDMMTLDPKSFKEFTEKDRNHG